jgi:chromosome segregation ATPase
MDDGTAAVRKRKLLRGPRRNDDEMQAPRSGETALRVELCQLLPQAQGKALLRVVGRWNGPAPADVAIRLGDGSLVAPLAPGAVTAAGGLWTSGFEVPLVESGAEIALVSPAGVVPLRPTERNPDADGPALRKRCEMAERELEALRGKLVQAWNEVAQMRETVNGREAEYESAQRRAAHAVGIVDDLRARATGSEAELAAVRAELDRREDASTRAADLAERFEAARTRAEALDGQLTHARWVAHEAMDVAARAARELIAERAKAEEATELAERRGEALARSERELGEARAALAAAETRASELATELAGTGAELAAAEAELSRARDGIASAESAREQADAEHADRVRALEGELEAARDALAKLEADNTDRHAAEGTSAERIDALEAELAAAREQLTAAESARTEAEAGHAARADELEAEVEALRDALVTAQQEARTSFESHTHESAPDPVQEDLRHLLAARQRELDEARADLKEQRARYAAIASKMSPTELAATTDARPASTDWSALDDELLDRLARAKELSQQD